MPRIRSIKPDFWEDEAVGQISIAARLLFIGTWTLADDTGRLRWNAAVLRGHLFAYDTDMSLVDVAQWMGELVEAGLIWTYLVDGQQLAVVCGFTKHQKISHPTPSRHPAPDQDVCGDSGTSPETFGSDSGTSPETFRPERAGVRAEARGGAPARARGAETPISTAPSQPQGSDQHTYDAPEKLRSGSGAAPETFRPDRDRDRDGEDARGGAPARTREGARTRGRSQTRGDPPNGQHRETVAERNARTLARTPNPNRWGPIQ